MRRLLPAWTLALLLCTFGAADAAAGWDGRAPDAPWAWHPMPCIGCAHFPPPAARDDGAQIDAFVRDYVLSDPILGAGEHLFFPIAIDGDTLVVNAVGDTGGLHVFVRAGDDWLEQAHLLPANGQFELFVQSAAIDGDTLVLGQPARTGSNGYPLAGGVSVFVRDGTEWTLQADLQLDDALDGDYFGLAVAIEGDTLVATRPRTQSQVSPGDAQVFVRDGTTWTHQATLTASEPQFATAFAYSAAISGAAVVLGEPGHSLVSGDVTYEGAAYVFVRSGDTWTQQARFVGSAPFDQLGLRVDVSGDIAVANISSGNGGVYVYRNDGSSWMTPPTFIASPNPDFAPQFGYGLAVDDGIIVAGDFNGTSIDVPQSGAAHVYMRVGDEWIRQTQLQDDTPVYQNHFGELIAIDAGTILVGELGGPAATGSSLHVFDNVAVPTTTMITATQPQLVLQGDSYEVYVSVVADHPSHGAPFGTVLVGDLHGDECTIQLPAEDHCSLVASYANPADPFGTFIPLTAIYSPAGPVAYLGSQGAGFETVFFVDALFTAGFE